MITRVRTYCWAMLALIAAAGCTCEAGTQKSNGLFVLSPKSIDYATGCLHDTNERTVILENQGNSDLAIVDMQLKGSAYTFLDAERPTVIPAGEQVPVVIGFTPETAEEFDGSLTVTTDAEENAVQKVNLIGRGFAGERYELHAYCACTNEAGSGRRICGMPEGKFDTDCTFLSFDDVLAGAALERTVRLQNKGCAAVDVNEALFVPDNGGTSDDVKFFSFSGDSTGSVRGGEFRDVKVKFTAPAAESTPLVRLNFASTDPSNPAINIGLFANSVAPALNVDKEVITFFEAQAGVALKKTFAVSNQGTAALKVDSVTLAAENGTQDFALELVNGETSFTLTPAGTPGSERLVTAVYTSSGPGSDKAKAVVKAGQETREVRLLGGTEPLLNVVWLTPPDTTGEQQPPVDFGQVDTGSKGTPRTVRIKNDGQAPLTVQGVAVTDNPGNSFKLTTPWTGTLAAGTSKDLTVTLDDSVTLRDDAAKLKITSNDPVDAANGGARSVDLKSSNEPNFRPVITIETSSAPTVCKELVLDASKTTGPEAGDTLTFKWEIGTKPAGSTARLESATQAVTRVLSDKSNCAGPDVLGTYGFKVTVTDQFGNLNDTRQTVIVR